MRTKCDLGRYNAELYFFSVVGESLSNKCYRIPHDLAHVFTDLSLRNDNDTTYVRLSIITIKKYLHHSPDDFGMIWNAGFDCVSLGDCNQAHYYF